MRGKIMSCVLIVLSVTILVGVGLTTWFMLRPVEQENFLNLNLENGKAETVEFKDLNMVPGKTVSYTMFVFSEIDDDYELAFDFQEVDGEVLKDYIDVTVKVGEEVILHGKLAALLSDNAKIINARLQEGIPYTVTIEFSMAEDVGNEPMGAEALFYLVLTANNE